MEWARPRLGRRVLGITLALALEVLLLLLLLTLGQAAPERGRPGPALTTFDVRSTPREATAQPEPEEQQPQPQASTAQPAEAEPEEVAEPVEPGPSAPVIIRPRNPPLLADSPPLGWNGAQW